MPGIVIARFVIERDPVRDYQIVETEGARAQDLINEAWALLDVLGQPRPGGHEQLHAWLGPVGAGNAHFVRVVVERFPGGELRYHQLWYAAGDLPTRPACVRWQAVAEPTPPPAGWPDDIDRIVSLAKTAVEAGGMRQAPVHPLVDPLSYCDALATAFGAALGPQITWVTKLTDRSVPVHLRFVPDPTMNEPNYSPTPVSPAPAKPRKLIPPRVHSPPRHRQQLSWGLLAIVLFLGVVLGAIAGYSMRGNSHAQVATPPPAPRSSNAGKATPAAAPLPLVPQPDPAHEELQIELLSSYDAVRKLQDFLGQPGLAKDDDQTQIRETVVMTDLLDFGSADKQKFNNAEVRKLLDLLEKLLRVYPAGAGGPASQNEK